MRLVVASAPPGIPEPVQTNLASTAPCGVRVRPCRTLCSMCFDYIREGVALSDGENLCVVCACAHFEGVEMAEAAVSCRPPLALFARRSDAGTLLREDLCGIAAGRARELMGSVRTGDLLRCCGCTASRHVGGHLARFVGYCTRRQLAVLRLEGDGDAVPTTSLICVRTELLRRPNDEATTQHAAMIASLLQVGASVPTLQNGLAAVKAAHTLCGTELLGRAQSAVESLTNQTGFACSVAECVGEAYPTAHGLVCPARETSRWSVGSEPLL